MSDPEISEAQVSKVTPKSDNQQIVSDEDFQGENKMVEGSSKAKDEVRTIDSPPQAVADMTLSPTKTGDSYNGRSSITLSDDGSGYDRDTNECSEFCLDCCSCFGLFDNCCPTDSEGCITSTAVFIGNILFSCCRCK